jgi:hypothetical protein
MNELFRRSYSLAVRAQADATPSVDVIASSTALDGYGEIVAQDWDLRRYEANPVVLYGHNSYAMPIGHASNVRVEGDKLLATLNFVDARANPMAEQVWQGVLQGSLRAVSVGFRSKCRTSTARTSSSSPATSSWRSASCRSPPTPKPSPRRRGPSTTSSARSSRAALRRPRPCPR